MDEKEIEQFGKGALHSIDSRDFIPLGGADKPFDWNKATDSDNEWGTIESQGSSLSCTGQTTAGITGFKEGRRVSARAVYCQTYLPQGGAYVRDSMDVGAKQIAPYENDFPSYPNSEDDMRNSIGLKKEIRERNWVYVSLPLSIDSLAISIQKYTYISLAFFGSNDGWGSQDITFTRKDRAHNVIGIRPVLRGNKKTIKIRNSWGAAWGEKGFGYIDEEYLLKAGICAYAYVTEFIKPIKYILKNGKIAKALWFLPANKGFINALYKERYDRDATILELKKFVGIRVKDAANIILGAWRSPFYGKTN